MKEKIKKLFENGRGVIFALFILQFIVTIFITPNRHDDAWFLEQVTGRSIIEFALSRYSTWTSRLILEITECLVLKTSKYLWVLIESLMFALARIFNIKNIYKKRRESTK